MAIFEGITTALVGSLVGDALGDSNRHDQQDYQTQMSNTSYQRAVADLNAAGLSPMLAYQRGGASTPTAPGAAPPVNAAESFNQSRAVSAQTKVADSSVELNTAAAGKAAAEADLAGATAAKVRAETPGIAPLQGAQTTHALASASAASQSVQESVKRIEEIDQKISNMGIEQQQMFAIIRELGTRANLNMAHVSLIPVQQAALRAGIQVDKAKALELTSLLPEVIATTKALARETNLRSDILQPQSGAYASVAPWAKLGADLFGGAIGSAAGGFFGARKGGISISNNNSAMAFPSLPSR